MQIEFLGAARTVTGSMHLVHLRDHRILLECGLFQGPRREALAKNRTLPFRARDVDVVVLSHAHIDHSGALPVLYKNGYRGPVYCTPATRDLCAAMLEDAAMIQAQDARYINKLIERGESDMEPVEPLYDENDVLGILGQMVAVPYHRQFGLLPGVELTFLDAGHILGSAGPVLDIDDDGKRRRLAFSGDIGQHATPILRDPEAPKGAHVLLMESTYGDRLHGPRDQLDERAAQVLARTYDRKGKVIVPSFAMERAQEVVFLLKRLKTAGKLPPFRVYVDSPLTVKVTEVFKMHPDSMDDEVQGLLRGGESPFEFDGLEYVESVEGSKAIAASSEPAIVISASGMCESGRVLHHLKATIESARNTVMIVGFQAPHTLGRRLVEGRSRVRIFGVERDRRAEVVVMNGLSAHGDRDDLLQYFEEAREGGALEHLALVHGEPKAQDALAREILGRKFRNVHVPERGDTLEIT